MEIEAMLAGLDARQRTSEHRIRDLENDLRDLRDLTNAVAVTGEGVRELRGRVEELHEDVKQLTLRPARRWDTALTAALTGAVSALAGAAAAIVLR